MLITGNTPLLLFAAERAHRFMNDSCRGAASTNNRGQKPKRPTHTGLNTTGSSKHFTATQFTYVNRQWGVVWGWEHDDSLSLNLSFVFTAKGPNSSPLMVMQESTRKKEERCNNLQQNTLHLLQLRTKTMTN